MSSGYIVVEGPHEVEFIGKILSMHGFVRITMIDQLSPFWKKLIPTKFPFGGDLKRRMPIPDFFCKEGITVVIHSAVGIDGIVKTISSTISNSDDFNKEVKSVGIVFDADFGKNNVQKKFIEIRKALNGILTLPDQPGMISNEGLLTGVYILPDNKSDGTLEDLLLLCAEKNYNALKIGATNFIDGIDIEGIGEEKREFKKPAGKKKAIVGCIGNVLKPGKSIQVSIQDNKWVDGETIIIDNIEAFNDFIVALLELE